MILLLFNNYSSSYPISSVPSKFPVLRKCRKWCKRSKLNVKMLKSFSSFLSGFNVISKKKKVIALTGASFSPISWWSPKKKRSFVSVLQIFSPLCATYQSKVPWTAAVYVFWREKKRQNLQNFRAKMPETISHFWHFFALLGNTAYQWTP